MKSHNLDSGLEFADNPDQRCACVLLLDTSGSMEGQRITELNTGLRTFKEKLLEDSLAMKRVDLAILSFDSNIKVVKEFGPIENFEVPQLTAQYQTYMGTAICQALDMLEERKMDYRNNDIQFYRPWLVIITDGHPEGESEHVLEEAIERLRNEQDNKKVKVFPIAVGTGIDLSELSHITGTDALRLDEAKWKDMFVWLSASLQKVSHSQQVGAQVALSPPSWHSV